MIQETLKAHKEQLHNLLPGTLLKPLDQRFKALITLLEAYEESATHLIDKLEDYRSPGTETGFINDHLEHRKSILALLESWMSRREKHTPETFFSDFDDKIAAFCHDMEAFWFTAQAEERFRKLPGDPRSTVFIKALKRGSYALHRRYYLLEKWVRTKLGKKEKQPPVWRQKIPARSLTLRYYENRLFSLFAPVADDAMKTLTLLANELWQADERFFRLIMDLINRNKQKAEVTSMFREELIPAIHATKEKIEAARKELRPSLKEALRTTDKLFAQQVEIAGTLESPAVLGPEVYRKHRRKKIRRSYVTAVNRRLNTLFVLADDWKFNQEAYILTGNAALINLVFQNRLQDKKKAVSQAMLRIKRFLTASQKDIHGSDPDTLTTELQTLKYSAGKNLHNIIIPEVSRSMVAQEFPELITGVKDELCEALSLQSRKRILIRDFDPGKAYADKALEGISLRRLIEFEIAGGLNKSIIQCRMKSIGELNSLDERFQDLGRMVLFNVESALLMPEKQKDTGLEELASEAKAGIQRALDTYEELSARFADFIEAIQQDVDYTVSQLYDALLKLTDNTHVEKIRYRILRTKALKNRERVLIAIKTVLKTALQKSRAFFRAGLKKAISMINVLRSYVGLQKLSKDISIEVSDFLASDHDRIQKLPFVYRRLFVNEPLDDAAFYFPRKTEKDMLINAYKKWREGSFTATLIYGEKGSGISTFVHMFSAETLTGDTAYYQCMPDKRLKSEEQLFELLGNSLRGQAFAGYEEFLAFVEENAPFVLFVDKLHLFYMRQPAGFQLLKRLFEIISATSKQVFWMCSCGLYAATFLDKAIGMFGYFPQLIKMKSLETEKVRKIIMLRHNASGYKLHFLPSKEDQQLRNFLKKPEEEQQLHLREKFFEKINGLSQSNISFALQLWLHSSSKVEENVVYMNSLDTLDLSFIYNLPDEVIFGLHALVLHEILNEEELAYIMNTGKAQAFMMMMRLKDRGIITQNNGMFSIHPLLYRQSLALLLDKNLIY